MDPLSITLAVVTLATAVKDMVELAQKIHESFAKASINLRNAQCVAEDIKEMAREIKIFYDDHQDALDNMTDFRVALQDLLEKFRSFEQSILPLLPRTGGRRRDRFMRGWDAWRNNNKIEGSILDLQSNIVNVMRRHIMKSTMRAEVKLESIHQETTRGLASITQGLEVLEVVRRDVSAIRVTAATTTTTTMTHRSNDSSGTPCNEFDRTVVMFAQSSPSTSAPMLRTPTVITEELMTVAYIKLQVNRMAMTVDKMSTLPVSAPNSVVEFFLSPILLGQAARTITHLRHHVVRQVTSIRDLLNPEHMQTIPVDEGASAMTELAAGLQELGMRHECIVVANWAVALSRTLVDASGREQPDYAARLACCLLNQSCRASVDDIQSLQTIKEAYTITQSLRNQHAGQIHFQILYSNILLQRAEFVDTKRSIEMCVEAVQVIEDILHVQAYPPSEPPSNEIIGQVVQPRSSFLDRLFSSAPTIASLITYAHALQRLGTYVLTDGHPKSALDLGLLAIAVQRKIVSVHGDDYKVELAGALSSLVQGGAAHYIPIKEHVDLADECIQLLRELVEKNPVIYARELVYVLWSKADTLASWGQDAEAIATWEEAASLAGQIVQDSELCATTLNHLTKQFRRLKRHNDAVRTGTLAITTYQHGVETQAEEYLHLARDLQQLRRYLESAEAARTSVRLYRHLAMRDPGPWISHLTEALSYLARCLAALGDNSEALMAWKESLRMVDNFLNAKPDASCASAVIDKYLATLHTYPFISYILEDKEESLALCSTAIQYLRQLSKLYPQNADIIQHLLWAEYGYASTILGVGRPQDAQQYIDHWCDVWSIKSEAISEPEFAEWHAMMMLLKADILDAQGCTEQALLTTQRVNDFVRLSITTYEPLFQVVIKSMIQEAQLRVILGDSEEALKVAEGALRLSRDNKLEPTVDGVVWSLYGVAFAAISCRNYQRAVEAAREGRVITASSDCASSDWQSDQMEHDIFVHPMLLALLSSAEANLGRFTTALEYARRAVDELPDIGDAKSHISATSAERCYMETRGNLANILLATGDFAQARQICEERRAYFSKTVEKIMGDYSMLAPVLRILGVLCCSEGHHEEGDAAAQEVSRIMMMLGSAFPSLHEQVKIRLRKQADVPILKVLDQMGQRLDCEHQAGVVSLFAI